MIPPSFRVAQPLGKENPGAGHCLANGLRLPVLAGLHMQNVVAELILPQRDRIGVEMLVQDPHGPVVTVPGARAIILQGKQFRVAPRRVIGVLVINGITMPTPRSPRK